MSLPTTVTTVGELLAVLSKLPPEMRVVIADNDPEYMTTDCNVEVMYDDTWTDENYKEHEENVIRLNLGVAL